MRIFHLADIHIRTGSSQKVRLLDYDQTFENLFTSIDERCPTEKDMVVIAGDVFDNKNSISASSIRLFHKFVEGLVTRFSGGVIMIAGNHDWRQDLPDEPDILKELISVYGDKVIYPTESGTFAVNGVCFGVLTVRDMSLHGDSRSDKLADFTVPVLSEPSEVANVAILHGCINGCVLQNNTTAESGISIDMFREAGYNFVLAGDIHKQQVSAVNIVDGRSKLPEDTIYGYPGSLVQQNHGEPLFGHGYLVWDISEREIEKVHVQCPTGFASMRWSVKNKRLEVKHAKSWVNARLISKDDRCPNNLDVRISSDTKPEDVKHIFGERATIVSTVAEVPVETQQQTTVTNYSTTNTVDDWIDFISADVSDEIERKEISEIVTDIYNLLIPDFDDKVPDPKVVDRNTKITREINRYNNVERNVANRYIITYMEFSNLFCFGNDNYHTFTDGISVLNARNGDGKSSFLESIFVSIFGVGFPSKTVKGTKNFIIRNNSTKANTTIHFRIVGTEGTFVVKRTFYRKGDVTRSEAWVYDPSGKQMCSGKVATDNWIVKNFGRPEEFLMTTMMTQTNDCDFLKLDKDAQRKLLDHMLGIESVSCFTDLLKTSVTAYKYIVDSTQTVIKMKCNEDDTENVTQEQLDEFHEKLRDSRSRLADAEKLCDGFQRPTTTCKPGTAIDAQPLSDDELHQFESRMAVISDKLRDYTPDTDPNISIDDSLPCHHMSDEECESARKLITRRDDIIAELETVDFPFNPRCKVCKSQPWRIRREQLEAELADMKMPDVDPGSDWKDNKRRFEQTRLYAELQDITEKRRVHMHNIEIKARELYTTLDAVREEVIENERDVATLSSKLSRKIRDDSQNAKMDAYFKLVCSRYKTIRAICTSFAKYRGWLYSERVIPGIVSETNRLIRCVTFNESVKVVSGLGDAGEITWTAVCNGEHVPLERTSGFQRFIIGTCIRIAIQRVCVSSPQCSQIFVDEGFTSCDATHLAKVPDFLRGLADLGCGLMLVSHMSELSIGDNPITITSNRTNGSSLKSGIKFK